MSSQNCRNAMSGSLSMEWRHMVDKTKGSRRDRGVNKEPLNGQPPSNDRDLQVVAIQIPRQVWQERVVLVSCNEYICITSTPTLSLHGDT